MNNKKQKDRRNFIKKSVGLGVGAGVSYFFSNPLILLGQNTPPAPPDLVAVKNGGPDTLFNKAIASLGGMGRYVKKGQTVLVKPNMAFPKAPEIGTNTNPLLVKTIVEHCLAAGAKKVYVFDNVLEKWLEKAEQCYKISGVADAAKAAGATVVPANHPKYYQDIKMVNTPTIGNWSMVHEILLESDVFINVPILKHHSYTTMSSAMKNLMGVIWQRVHYHQCGLDNCIAEFCQYRKPDLNIIDAYRVMTSGGPYGHEPEKNQMKKTLLISQDMVAADSAAAMLLGHKPEDIPYIKKAHELGIGTMDLSKLNIKKHVLPG